MGQPATTAPGLMELLPMFVFPILIFYWLVLRPQRTARKAHAQMLKQLKKNDEVVTTGGLFGTVVNVKPESVTLRIDDNVRVEVESAAITRLVKTTGAEVASVEKRT